MTRNRGPQITQFETRRLEHELRLRATSARARKRRRTTRKSLVHRGEERVAA